MGGGHVFRGLSGATLPTKNIFTCIHHAGATRAELPAGHPGMLSHEPFDGDFWGPASASLCKSVYTVCGLLFTGRRPGEASPGQWLGEADQERQGGGGPFCPVTRGVSAPSAQGPSLKAWTDGFANPRWVWA